MRSIEWAIVTGGAAVNLLAGGVPPAAAQGGGPADEPAVTVRGQTYTPRSILARNMGADEDQTTAFPPHTVAVGGTTLVAHWKLPCDVPLGDHPAQCRIAEKPAQMKPGAPNPFVDPEGCWLEAQIQEAMLRAQLRLQKGA